MAVAYAVAATIVVDGVPLDEEVDPYVEQVLVDEHVGLPAMFAISLLDPQRDVLDRSGLRVASEVELAISGRGSETDDPLVKGEVVTVECEYDEMGSRVVVRGYAASHRLHRGRHTRAFVNATDTDILRQIAQEAEIELGDVEETSDVHEHVVQANVSDWEFLTARAEGLGFDLSVIDGKINFGMPTEAADAPGEDGADADADARDPRLLVFGDNLHAFHARISAAEQVAQVHVRGWDDTKKEAVAGSAPADTVAAELELADPSSLAHAFGDAEFVSVHQAVQTQAAADAAAKVLAERIGSSFVQADGIAAGSTALRAGEAVRVIGVSEDFSGTYVLSQTRHVIDRDGYRTQFTISGRNRSAWAAAGASGATPSSAAGDGATGFAGLVRGIVSENADPDKLGRVKVRLPWLDESFTSTWAPVMQLGSGPKSGTFFLPAVDDEVLVGFEHGRVDSPIVIGGLFNGVDMPPPYGYLLDNGKVTGRGVWSRKGHKLMLHDADDISGITLATADSEVSIGLNALDKKLVIQTQGPVEIQAVGEMKLTGSKVTVQADGELILKGATVRIN
jgi:uncharacterized protein involved in type VI secretion and phage assembly